MNNIKGIDLKDNNEYALDYLLLIFIRIYILLRIINYKEELEKLIFVYKLKKFMISKFIMEIWKKIVSKLKWIIFNKH